MEYRSITTNNQTLIRKAVTCGGDIDSSNGYSPIEWGSYPIDTHSNLGFKSDGLPVELQSFSVE